MFQKTCQTAHRPELHPNFLQLLKIFGRSTDSCEPLLSSVGSHFAEAVLVPHLTHGYKQNQNALCEINAAQPSQQIKAKVSSQT
jgi:hypothetical protein